MNRTKKRLLSFALTLSLLLSLWGGWPVMALADELPNPFATMYDSEALVQEELSRDPLFGADTDSYMIQEAVREKLMREDRMDIQMEAVSDSFSLLNKTGTDLSLIETDLYQETTAALLLEREEELRDQYETERYIVKYKSESSHSLDTMTVQGTQSARLLTDSDARIERLTLPQAVNPRDLAFELQAAGAGREIVYIQPDFPLSLEGLTLELLKEVPAEEEEQVDPPLEEETPDSEEENPEEDPSEEPDEEETSEEPATEEPVEEDLPLPELADTAPVLVAVIDTGIDAEHPLLQDYMVPGWNFVTQSDVTFDPDYPLASAHGTHIAGQIAAIARETRASIQIMPLQVFDNGVAYTSDVLAAIEYAISQGASIINCSFGTTSDNPILAEIIESANALFVCAAGNSRREIGVSPGETPVYPAAYRFDNVISVGSVNADGGFSYFSNYSTDYVDITALGRDVVSAIPNATHGDIGEEGPMTGTSIAAGMVTGAAAAVLSAEGTLSVSDVRVRLLDSADRLDNLHNKVVDGRRVNLYNALLNLPGEDLTLNYEDDYDVHGFQTSGGALFELYSGDNPVIQVAAGQYNTVILKEDGTVWAWGRGLEDSRLTQVLGLSEIIAVAAGHSHNIALKSNGTVWTWGQGNYGQLGNGTNKTSTIPVQVSGLTDVISIAAGNNHSLAVKSNETAWAWGQNNNGQLGDGTTANKLFPVQAGGVSFTGVRALAGGTSHSLGLKTDGSAWAWGNNANGQLGDGTTANKPAPVRVGGASPLSGVIAISGGTAHSIALKSDGTVWSWGVNYYGQLGDGTTEQRAVPAQVSNLTQIVEIDSGAHHGLAIKSDNTVWSWGFNYYGQLGDNTTTNRSVPVQVIKEGQVFDNVSKVRGGYGHSIVLKYDGAVWAWGSNNNAQTGDGSTIFIGSAREIPFMEDVIATAAGDDHMLALTSDGTVWAWGGNSNSQLGDGTTLERNKPVQVKNLNGIVAITAGMYHSMALQSDGTVWAWGYNYYGSLGDGSTTNRSLPVKVGGTQPPSGFANIKAIAASYHSSVALTEDGTVWTWGYNPHGQLGDGTTTNQKLPKKVTGLPNITAIATSGYHCLALTNDGKVWGWGNNDSGQLGNGSTGTKVLPTQMNGLTGVTSIAAGTIHSIFVKDGNVWSVGANNRGQLGNGSQTSSLTPVQANGLADVKTVVTNEYHNLALKTDGSVWTWGDNSYGQLGDGTKVNRSLPIDTGLTGVTSISAGSLYSLAVKQGGSVSGWGNNAFGIFGLTWATNYLTPIQSQTRPDDYGDTKDLAHTVDGTSVAGYIECRFDEDWFAVTANTYSTVEVTLSSGNGHAQLAVYDAQGQRLADSGPYTMQAGETVYLRVSFDLEQSFAETAYTLGIQATGQTADATLTLNVTAGEMNYVAVKADNISSFAGKSYALTFENISFDALVLQSADINCQPNGNNVIDIIANKDIPSGKVWSGVLMVVRFKATATGTATLTVA